MSAMNNMGLGLHQTQKLIISPQLQHAIKLLQLSSLELAEKIETELAENPFLEEASDYDEEKRETQDEEYDSSGDKQRLEMDIHKRELDNLNEFTFFEDSSDLGYMKKSSNPSDENSKQQFLENAFAVETTVYDHLLSQLRLVDVSDKEFFIAEIIISSLDESGYFTVEIEDLAQSLQVEPDDILEVLKIIQSFDPAGIAGRDLQECLLIQIDQLEEKHPYTEEILRDHLSLLVKRKYKEIASKLKTSIDNVRKAVEMIAQLDPIPARQFDTKRIKYIVPDVFVEKVEGGFTISINDGNLPNLRFNNSYREALQNVELDKPTKNFFDDKYAEAKLLIFSLEKRKSTIRKVVEQIVEYQSDFFVKGPHHLKPLVLKDIANIIEMHESTVSRVTTNKYIETPWGIFPLKYFFSSAIRKKSGELKSSTSIKEMIKEVIENESGDSTLSDNKIVEILSNRGIDIARRTVAKYRKSLKILSSFERKEK